MSIVVAQGVVEVTANATGTGKKIASDIEEGGAAGGGKAGESMGKGIFGGILKGFALLGGTAAIVGYIGSSVSKASDLNETLNKSSVIFGNQAGAISKWGDTAAKNLGLSKSQAVAAASGFGDMFTQIGFTGDAAASMSTDVVQAAADLGSFSNLDTADVSERISAAFRGEYDSLQAVIPNISAARVESEALAMTGKTTASSLTAQEKAAAVLAIVHKDGTRAMGDFARTSGGAANQAKIVAASLDDQSAKLGGALLPAWTGFLGFLNDTVIPGFAWLIDNLPLVGSVLGGLAVALLVVFAPAIWGAVTATWAFTAALLANPITWVIIGITALVAGIIWLATQTTFFQDIWTTTVAVLGAVWQWLWDSVLNPVFTFIGAIFTWLYETIIVPVVTGIMIYVGIWAAIFTWLWETVVSPVFGFIGAIFTWLYTTIVVPIVNFIVAYIQVLGTIFTWLYANVISPVFAGIGAAFNWVWGNIINPVIGWIKGAINSVGSTVSSVFGGIAGFIGAAFQGALSVMRGPINGIIGLVNQAIRGLNSLHVTIPDWVPLVGGQTFGLSIPTIPMLARGSNNAPDTFIAGENGPELITGARGATVRPYEATRDILAAGGVGSGGNIEIVINEARDPMGSAGRVATELKAWRSR